MLLIEISQWRKKLKLSLSMMITIYFVESCKIFPKSKPFLLSLPLITTIATFFNFAVATTSYFALAICCPRFVVAITNRFTSTTYQYGPNPYPISTNQEEISLVPISMEIHTSTRTTQICRNYFKVIFSLKFN